MKLKALLAALAVAAILPVAAFADPASPSDKANGARSCQAVKTALGEAMFKSSYGTNADKSNAFGKCVSAWTQTEHQNRHAAETACKAEQADAGFAAAHGGKTFAQFYGTARRAPTRSTAASSRSGPPSRPRTRRLSSTRPARAGRSGRPSARRPSRPSTAPTPTSRTRLASASPSSPLRRASARTGGRGLAALCPRRCEPRSGRRRSPARGPSCSGSTGASTPRARPCADARSPASPRRTRPRG